MIATILFFTIFVLFIYYFKRLLNINDYWKDRGLPYSTPLPLFGNMFRHAIKKKSFGDVLMDIGLKFKQDKIIGVYNFTIPVLLINDRDYAQTVLVKEFSSFMNRGPSLKMNEQRPLDRNLFALTGMEWKAVRMSMAPVFSTGKLKGMIPQMRNIFQNTAIKYIDDNLSNEIDIKNIVETFTRNVRASCVFGMDISNMDLNSEFMAKVIALSNFGFRDFVSLTMALWFPKLAAKLNFSVFGARNETYFVDLLLKTFDERLKSGVVKTDFVQTLLELKQNGIVKVNQWHKDDDFLEIDKSQSTKGNVEISDDIIVAQSFTFLLAGSDTLRSIMTMFLIEISKDKRILSKLINEIDTVVNQNNGELSYTALGDMKYMDLCLKEIMRFYPAVGFLNRHCVKKFTFDNGVTVQPGTRLFIPIFKFHSDPEFFPEPSKFNPERFETSPPACSYLPFGEGPRTCIAMRFAMMELKMFLSQLLYTYEISLSSRTELPVKTDNWFFLRRVVSPVYMKFIKRKH